MYIYNIKEPSAEKCLNSGHEDQNWGRLGRVRNFTRRADSKSRWPHGKKAHFRGVKWCPSAKSSRPLMTYDVTTWRHVELSKSVTHPGHVCLGFLDWLLAQLDAHLQRGLAARWNESQRGNYSNTKGNRTPHITFRSPIVHHQRNSSRFLAKQTAAMWPKITRQHSSSWNGKKVSTEVKNLAPFNWPK